MRHGPLAVALLAAAPVACRDERPRPAASSSAASTASATAPAAACTPRSAEKIGIPFVRVCPPGEEGFWITAVPMGCSAGEHENIRCPRVTPLVRPVREGAAALGSVQASVVDRKAAARTCFMRMGGRIPSRAERSRARSVMGLSTVLVTESSGSSAEQFRFAELPEWVVEEVVPACDSPVEPGPDCVFGWFPSDARSPGVAWSNLRSCAARHVDVSPPGLRIAALGESCGVPGPVRGADAGSAPLDLPCALRSPARDDRGAPSDEAFTLACAPPETAKHPVLEDKDTAAYRCVLPESALGTFDLQGW